MCVCVCGGGGVYSFLLNETTGYIFDGTRTLPLQAPTEHESDALNTVTRRQINSYFNICSGLVISNKCQNNYTWYTPCIYKTGIEKGNRTT